MTIGQALAAVRAAVERMRAGLSDGLDGIHSRLASDAGHDIVRAVMSNWTTQANINLANAGEHSIAADGEYAMVVLSFDVLHDLSI